MRQLIAALVTATALASCSKSGLPPQPEQKPRRSYSLELAAVPDGLPEPTTVVVKDSDFAYLLTHLEVIAESPLPDELPPGSKSSYRILGVTQQGNCVGGCPPSTIYVVAFNYHDHLDGRIRLCRVDGVRWFSKLRVVSYKPQITDGPFLVFDVRSNPEPRGYIPYQVSVSPDGCSIKRIGEFAGMAPNNSFKPKPLRGSA